MLDNPNSNLRRHNSLPSSRTRPTLMKATYRKCSNLSLKSNPYVGWFRHSPPLTSHHHSTSLQNSEFTAPLHYQQQQQQNKSSPYVGWFRHAPSSCCKLDATLLKSTLAKGHFAEYLKQELPAILRSIPSLERHAGLYRLEDLLCSGHLLGGSPQLFLKNNERSSLSGKLFNVLACWLFQDDDIVLHHSKIWEATLEGNSNKKGQERFSVEESEHQEDAASCSSSSSSLSSIPSMAVSVDECDACSVQLRRRFSSLSCSSAMLSSQAEAYYVHNAVAGSRSDGANDGSGFGRLDYDISQMDIVRMARSASRHLDVESILRLPTITYQSRLTATRIPEETFSEEDDHSDSTGKPEEWSWMLVQEGGYGSKEVHHKDNKTNRVRSFQANHKSGLPDYPEDDVCVICLEQFLDGDRLRVLPCSHSFHVGCIDQWLSGSHSFDDCFTTGCPTCKKHACQDSGDDSSESVVPSWAFARIGDALARQDFSQHAE